MSMSMEEERDVKYVIKLTLIDSQTNQRIEFETKRMSHQGMP